MIIAIRRQSTRALPATTDSAPVYTIRPFRTLRGVYLNEQCFKKRNKKLSYREQNARKLRTK